MIFCKAVVIFALLNASALASPSVSKRSIFDSSYGFNSYDAWSGNGDGSGITSFSPSVSYGVVKSYGSHSASSISPGEIASAIQAAKEASANVMEAQRRVQEAKDDVIHQQHVASQKQADAALALQKTEAAAAVQQQEAKAAANGLLQAQQRLARAKAEVSESQRVAAAKEARAAAILQKSAIAAAHEIQKSDNVARKLSAIQSSESAALRQVNAAKQNSLTAASAAVAASADSGNHATSAAGPWYGQKVIQLQPWG